MTETPAQSSAAVPMPDEPPKSRKLGVVALILALLVAAISMTVAVISGITLGPITKPGSTGFNVPLNPSADNPVEAQVALIFILNLVFGSIAGTWALIQGLVAAVKKRGRLWGVLAMFVAAGAPIVALIAFAIATAVTTPAG
jgi:hypothetical protein